MASRYSASPSWSCFDAMSRTPRASWQRAWSRRYTSARGYSAVSRAKTSSALRYSASAAGPLSQSRRSEPTAVRLLARWWRSSGASGGLPDQPLTHRQGGAEFGLRLRPAALPLQEVAEVDVNAGQGPAVPVLR